MIKIDNGGITRLQVDAIVNAAKNDVHSIAFSAISTGVYGYPLDEATEIAVATVKECVTSEYKRVLAE